MLELPPPSRMRSQHQDYSIFSREIPLNLHNLSLLLDGGVGRRDIRYKESYKSSMFDVHVLQFV